MNDGKRQVTDETEPDENPIATRMARWVPPASAVGRKPRPLCRVFCHYARKGGMLGV